MATDRRSYKSGDWVIYRKPKFSQRPGPRAKHISPAPSGDTYSYIVEKLWVVERVQESGALLLRTRRGKQLEVPMDDPNLHRPSWWQKWIYRSRFPTLTDPAAPAAS